MMTNLEAASAHSPTGLGTQQIGHPGDDLKDSTPTQAADSPSLPRCRPRPHPLGGGAPELSSRWADAAALSRGGTDRGAAAASAARVLGDSGPDARG